ncbi:MAG: porin family protein [Bacteroidaceae bacterium]|nr:porin family protein [Bacteroidaceae bacterium]
MKKNVLSIVVLVATLTFAMPAQAQFQFGIKAGLNVNSVSLKNMQSNIDGKNRTGFFAGVTADFTAPLIGIGADVSLLYNNKIIGLTENGQKANKTLHYVALPINVKYTIGLSNLASVYLATGPQFAWNVGDRNWKLSNYQGFTEDWELKKSEFSWNVGAGVTALNHIRIGYNYNIGIGKTAETTLIGTAGNTVKGKLKNNTHQISLTYLF